MTAITMGTYNMCLWLAQFLHMIYEEEFEDTKGAIGIRKSKKNRQPMYNGHKKKDKRTNNNLQN
jgi:hypothetical protein